jgi:hypothetical protein
MPRAATRERVLVPREADLAEAAREAITVATHKGVIVTGRSPPLRPYDTWGANTL